MNMTNRIARITLMLTLSLPSAAVAQVTPPPVPENLEIRVPNEPFLLGRAAGTQNYACQPVDSIGRVGWVLFTPQATLFGDLNEQLTTHFFSPNPFENNIVRAAWQDSTGTSTVWAKVVEASTDPAFVAPGAIAWLLLDVETTGAQVGPTGGALLIPTTFIQRLNTAGGSAPSTGCERPKDIGKKAFVPYTADYFFFRKPLR
jgi:hypothetical protein